jgi:toxin ParE1/3/4
MKYRVKITDPAETDIRNIYRHIVEEFQNVTAAVRRASLIKKRIKSLNENPARFPLVRDDFLAAKGFRITVVKTQNIFYIIREKEKAVSVMRILNERRDWARTLKSDNLTEGD